jgi:asparagine N-glycosylation enzyme membrane subunit Stt3
MSKTKWLLLGIVALAVILRIVLSMDDVFSAGFINFPGPDSYFHAAQIKSIAITFPAIQLDNSFWFYDWLIVAVDKVLPGPLEITAVFIPPILAGITVLLVYLIASKLFNKNAALLSAFFLAIMPGEYLQRSLLGTIDHHVFEVFITTTAALLVILMIQTWNMKSWKTWFVFTFFLLTMTAFLFTWNGFLRFITGDIAMADVIRGTTTEAIPTVVAISPHPMIHIVMVAIGGFVLLRWGKGWQRFLIIAWGIVMIAATLWQTRFDYYLIIPTVLLIGYSVNRLFNAETFKEMVIPRALAVVIVGMILYITIPTNIGLANGNLDTPSEPWNETLVWISDNTPEDAVIIAWWDYGYWIRYRGERTEYVNGGQDKERIKEISQTFLSSENVSVPGDYVVIDENTAYYFTRAMQWWSGIALPYNYDVTMARRLYELQPVDGYRYVYGNEVKVFEVLK